MAAPDLPPLNALRAFEAAARLGSLSRAAGELHVTHGAISRQVRLLEEELGVALFHRDGRRLRLTEAGRRLAEATGSAFAGIRSTVRGLRRGGEPGTRVIGCPGSLLARWMIPRLERLRADLPGLQLHLSPHEGAFAPALPGLDAALLIGAPPWPPQWRVHVLAPERVGPVVDPRHPAAARIAGRPPSALIGEALLHTASRPQAWPEWARRQGIDPAALRMGTGFEHLYYLLEAALAGLGVAIAPQPLVAAELEAGRLVAPWGFVETGAHWCLCTRAGDDPQLERLAGWLRAQLAATDRAGA
ncbi:DNA-binding transcriptional LysR family regulator [Luteimonas sp. J16]|jgi:DNA-binding transcriptional LysR family regulator|uniref:LysR family transcriptional regulator n=1 Tax=unclassified Luteimonas TaxID=2629088 RepID=UPI00047EF318|nr:MULTISPECIES: LysR family transcriptional regulator [unclassified Luteimonas]TWG88778.1 DNA-binding transcriptional LysR family regulator [Luteimonas sp. J16]